ncbi:MAG: hypothetical protein PHT48_06940 [Dechloromonas sp.]|nr:hypothetical protein [Dechloromonas sp.]
MRKYPLTFVILSALGLLSAIPGLLSLAGFGALIHPVLDDPMAGLAFIVSAVALLGSAAFPWVIAKLKAGDHEANQRTPRD